MSLLSARELSIGHDIAIQAGLNFSVDVGDVLLVKGHSGVGKSTLIKSLLGEKKALSGDILEGTAKLNKVYLPQLMPHELPLSMTLGEILSSFEVNLAMQEFFSARLHEKRWVDASGGERQKTLILSRLSNSCDILFMDEPFNHLDTKSITEVTSFLSSLLEKGFVKALVVVSHVEAHFHEKLKIKTLVLT